MKHYIHFIAPLALWVIGLALYIVTISKDIPKRVDSVKTYQLQKKPHAFTDAWFNIKDSFSTYWPSDDCYAITNFTGNTDCITKRTTLSSDITTQLECQKYPSQMCNCILFITNGIKNPNSTTGKNLGGRKDATIFGVESCRWLMHNAHTAVFTGKTWAQKTALLLLILTLITGNAFDWVVVNYMLRNSLSLDNTSRTAIKSVILLFWGMLSLAITVTADNNTYLLFLLILIPPIIILVLYELYSSSYNFQERPFIHPYVFATVMGALSLLAHAEMGVLDFDIIVYEIIKCNIAAYIYLQVVWKYMIKYPSTDVGYSRFVEDGTLRSVLLVFILYFVGLVAPYAKTNEDVYIWYTPFLWAVLAFASITWICSFQYNEFFGDNTRGERKLHVPGQLSTAAMHVSALVLAFTVLLVMYYLRENYTVFKALIDIIPVNSMQYNTSVTWQRAPAIGS